MSNIFIISGPTGSGETTITKEIIKHFPNFARLVTATTRDIRSGEKDGRDYYFFTQKKFKEEAEKGNILEYTYIKNRDVYYGSYKPDFENKIKNGLNIIVNSDMVGTKFYKENYNAVTIFIHPGTVENLGNRLKKRNPEISEEELKKRVQHAQMEIREEMSYYDYVICNEEGKLEEAVKKVAEIIKNNVQSS